MKQTKRLTTLFLAGSLALCSVPTTTNTGFFSRFFHSKQGGLATAAMLIGTGALMKFYVKDQKVTGGLFPYLPFRLKTFGELIKNVATDSPFTFVPAISLFLGETISKSPIFQFLSYMTCGLIWLSKMKENDEAEQE